MEDINFTEMLQMQRKLWEKHQDTWSPLEPKAARNSLLWMVGEIGEVIDIIKKCDETRVMEDEDIKAALTEELCDVLMYFNDVLLRYDISPGDLANAYVDKHYRNMNRSFDLEVEAFTDQLKGNRT